MGGGGGGGKTTSSTIAQAPKYLKPYIVDMMGRADGLSDRPYQAYSGEQVAPLNAQHQLGMNMVKNRAQNGDPTFNAANTQTRNTLSGNFLGQGAYRNEMAGMNNPFLDQVINNTNSDITRSFTNSTMPQTDASMARAGAFGGSAWQQANAENNRQMAAELAKNTANMRMNDYQTQQQLSENLADRQSQAWAQERANMMQSVGQGQQLSNQAYTDAQNMLGAGDITRDYQQTMDNQRYQNFLNQQNWPLQNLDILGNAISRAMGSGGSSVSSSSMPTVNRTASMIGGALAGGSLGSSYGNAGTAAGAGLGALSGLL